MRIRNDEEQLAQQRAKAAQTAQKIISGELGILAGCRLLIRLGITIVDDWRIDKDFVVFGGLDSDTDHLPLEDQRKHWDPDAFAKKQLEVQEIENRSRERVINACKSILARFGSV